MRMVATSLVLAVGLTVALIPAAGAAEGQTEIVEDIETVVAVADPASPDFGKSKDNGWKAIGLPWGRRINPDLMWENAKTG